MTDLCPRLQTFIDHMSALVSSTRDEAALLAGAREPMRALVAIDDWLPEAMTRPHPQYYQQYLLHCDTAERFCVVSFVWGPGQRTPIHDHTVWGVIGMLRGAERATPYRRTDGKIIRCADEILLEAGDVELVSPLIGDIHQVTNAHADRVSISVHAYGANIGKVRRHVFDPQTGAATEFVSGYAN